MGRGHMKRKPGQSRPWAAVAAVILLCGFDARFSTAEEPPASIVGHWEGELLRQGARLPVSFDFSAGPLKTTGTFTSLTQRAMEFPLDTVAVEGRTVHFALG